MSIFNVISFLLNEGSIANQPYSALRCAHIYCIYLTYYPGSLRLFHSLSSGYWPIDSSGFPVEKLQEPRFTRCPHLLWSTLLFCSPHEPECLPGARIYCEAVLAPCRLVPIFITKVVILLARSSVFWAVGYVLYHSAKNSAMTQYFASHVLSIAGQGVNTTRIKNIHHNSYIFPPPRLVDQTKDSTGVENDNAECSLTIRRYPSYPHWKSATKEEETIP